MLFTVPADPRASIWRRAHFSLARDRVAPSIAPRHVFIADRFFTNHPLDIVRVHLNIPGDKVMRIYKIKSNQGFCEGVCVVSQNNISCLLLVNETGVRLIVSTDRIDSSWNNRYERGWVDRVK